MPTPTINKEAAKLTTKRYLNPDMATRPAPNGPARGRVLGRDTPRQPHLDAAEIGVEGAVTK
jgi:hypothetical protein